MQYSPASLRALQILRDPSHFQWYVVPLFAFVVYFYVVEASKRNWDLIAAGLAYYAIEWIGEILNSLIMHFSGWAPLWGEPGPTAYLILVGINVETTLMFMVFGLAVGKLLEVVRQRWIVVLAFSLLSVSVETLLNAWGALSWDYTWWGWPNIWSVVLFAYAPAVIFAIWLHDMRSLKTKFALIGATFVLDVALLVLFVPVLGWI
jgi:hypothetical protein